MEAASLQDVGQANDTRLSHYGSHLAKLGQGLRSKGQQEGQTPPLPPGDWVQRNLEWKANLTIGPGLSNLGNTCFCNAVLQCLTHTAPLANFCLQRSHSTRTRSPQGPPKFDALLALEAHIVVAFDSGSRVVAPTHMVANLQGINSHFRAGAQQDAHEFMRLLIDNMQRVDMGGGALTSPDSRHPHPDLLHSIFGGYLRSRVQCGTCGDAATRDEAFLDLSLGISQVDTVAEALSMFTTIEELDGDNKFNCRSCGTTSRATKSLALHRTPRVLQLHLKRFGDFGGGGNDKDSHQVTFTELLDVRPYMMQGVESRINTLLYTLYAVIVHTGRSMWGGHYFAYVRDSKGAWFKMNDHKVSPVSLNEVLRTQAYMLFYARTDTDLATKTDDHQSSQVDDPGTEGKRGKTLGEAPTVTAGPRPVETLEAQLGGSTPTVLDRTTRSGLLGRGGPGQAGAGGDPSGETAAVAPQSLPSPREGPRPRPEPHLGVITMRESAEPSRMKAPAVVPAHSSSKAPLAPVFREVSRPERAVPITAPGPTPLRVSEGPPGGAATQVAADSLMTTLSPIIRDLHIASAGNIISLVQVISDLLRHPVPPQVVRRILRPQDDPLDGPGPDVTTLDELAQAIEEVIETGDMAQMFAVVITCHTVRLQEADAKVNSVIDMLLEFHTKVEGDLSKVGLLLADLAPAPHTGVPINREMARALLQCYSGTQCTFQGLLHCLKRLRDKPNEEDGFAKVIAAHLLPIADRPVLVGQVTPAQHPEPDTQVTSPSCRLWRETLREWLMDKEAFEAVPHLESPWEDSDSSNPSRSWTALLDFFQALQGNVTNWIHKMELNDMYTLAAHGEDLFGLEGANAKVREERRLDLKLNKDAWNLLSGRDQEDWITHLITNGAQQIRRLNPCIVSWNAGPHGYRNSRDEIWSLFAQGQPIICLQDLRIPRKKISGIKDELHNQFPHY